VCLVSNVILRSEATKNLRVELGITRIKPHRSETLRGVYPEQSVRGQGDIIVTFNTKPLEGEELYIILFWILYQFLYLRFVEIL
jgi:hypothetical protein